MCIERDIIDTVTRLFWRTDHHEWDKLTDCFADRVRLDYTALAGGEPHEMSPYSIVEAWRPGFEAIDAHQHLVTNHLVNVSGNQATLTAAFQATHQYAGQTWILGGDYHFTLARDEKGWRVTGMTMTPIWQTGNPGLIAEAAHKSNESSPESGVPRCPKPRLK